MRKNSILTATIAICFILFSGCKKTIDHPSDPDLAEVVPSPCTDPPLRSWLFEQYFTWGKEATLISASLELRLSDLANFYTLYYENSAENQYFGIKGEHTDQVNKDFKALKLFWDIKDKNIIVVVAHGSLLRDRSKIFKMYKSIYNYNDDKANHYADSIATLLKIYPQFLEGDHPAFTFNQFAIPDTTIANVGQVPAKIIIGDGLLQGFDRLGYGDIAPQAVLAHEFGHHIQYELGILKTGMKLNPKTSRRIELMADAYAGYFLSHTRGAAIELNKLQQVADVFFNTGDCDFSVDSHHGTPTQREKATEWGYNLAINAQQQNDILPIDEFARLFDGEYLSVL
jgi:hypothetical protein